MRSSCIGRCSIESKCTSFNIGPPIDNHVMCQLSNSDHMRHPGDLKPKEGFTYRATEVRNSNAADTCLILFSLNFCFLFKCERILWFITTRTRDIFCHLEILKIEWAFSRIQFEKFTTSRVIINHKMNEPFTAGLFVYNFLKKNNYKKNFFPIFSTKRYFPLLSMYSARETRFLLFDQSNNTFHSTMFV